MSVAAIPANRFFPAYVKTLDTADGVFAEVLRSELTVPPVGQTSIELERQDALLRLEQALTDARAGGIHVSARTMELARAVIQGLPAHVPLPEIDAEEDGEIALDWHVASDRSLTITTGDHGYLGYSSLVGLKAEYGRAPFTGALPDTILVNLLHVYPLSTTPRRR